MVVTVEQRKSRWRRDSIWAIINSYIVLITENLTISTSMYVSDGMCTAEILVFHLHKNFTLLSVNGKKWTKSNKNKIKILSRSKRFSSRSAVFLLNCVFVRTFIATTTRITIIIKPFIMKQEKPLRRAPTKGENYWAKKSWCLFSTWAIKVDIHM